MIKHFKNKKSYVNWVVSNLLTYKLIKVVRDDTDGSYLIRYEKL